MASSPMNEALQHLRSAALLRERSDLSDAQLLEAFLGHRDETALAVLVLRHAPMVWGVCRRILRDEHDAEDAFQATFLVLVRKASSIGTRELLASWLYAVAARTARKARATVGRRRSREVPTEEMPEPAAPRDPARDLRDCLDQELARLPEKYRIPIVLCDLEGKTRQEAAQELGWPEGTVAGRLARARAMLAKFLSRHGVTLGDGALAALAQEVVTAPMAVVASTIQSAGLLATGQAGNGVIAAAVLALTEGVVNDMWRTRLKMAAVLVAILLGTGLATAALLYPTRPATDPPVKPGEEKTPKEVLAAMQGDWRVSKLDVQFAELKEQFEPLGKVTIKGDKVTLVLDLTGQNQEKDSAWMADMTILKVDPTKSPPTIDIRLDKRVPFLLWGAREDPEANKPHNLPGIYHLEGDTLKLFFAEERPRDFPEKEKQGVVTLKRAPKGKE
jgi:RNA polymerase sigma factor (sigma-70 family)